MKKSLYTEEQVGLIEGKLKEEMVSLKDWLKEEMSIPAGNVEKSTLTSPEKLVEQQDQNIDQLIEFTAQDIKKAIVLFVTEAKESDPTELNHLNDIFLKITSVGNIYLSADNIDLPTEEDCAFLEKLARRKLERNHLPEASCMYRFLIQVNQSFSEGWVGWAVCEQEQGHVEVVEMIYQMALQLLPFDCYICLFAADFYVAINQAPKAVEVLEKTKQCLIDNNLQQEPAFREIEAELSRIKV